jgi:hypothetical protein
MPSLNFSADEGCWGREEFRPSNQGLLLARRFRSRLLEVQIRLVIGMLGALCVVEQGGDREQLHARILLPVRALVEAD